MEVQITTFYVLDTSLQTEMIETIDTFFEEIEKKQRIVQFYRRPWFDREREKGRKWIEEDELLFRQIVESS